MIRYFNTAGPCYPDRHYMVPALARLPEARELAERGFYFVLHAPRQTGKTTLLHALAHELSAASELAAVHVSCETAGPFGDDIGAVELLLLERLRDSSQDLAPALQPPAWPDAPIGNRLLNGLKAWAMACPRRLVLLLDEIDALEGRGLLSVLKQLRDGYTNHRDRFPFSVALCGVRDVRDYKAASGGDPDRLGTSSPFNIKVESLRLGDLDEPAVRMLYEQHAREAGQPVTEPAIRLILDATAGQPWLVNAVGDQIVRKMRIAPPEPITAAHVEAARERLILARATHLDSLLARLGEPRVRRVMEPLIAGGVPPASAYADDVRYLRDLGLLAPQDPLQVANPIYREVLVRELGTAASGAIVADQRTFVRADGTLDARTLLVEFVAFWAEHGETLLPNMPYHEVAPQLVLMAYLQRVVNGGGSIDREYGVGRGRIDLLVRWPTTAPDGRRSLQRIAVELKVWRDGRPDPTPRGLEQLEAYLERLGLSDGTLVIFDRRKDAPPVAPGAAFQQTATPTRGFSVTLVRI